MHLLIVFYIFWMVSDGLGGGSDTVVYVEPDFSDENHRMVRGRAPVRHIDKGLLVWQFPLSALSSAVH